MIGRIACWCLFAALTVVAAPALGQRARAVYPDEAVGTRDAMIRVRELTDAGNTAEALRVLQKTIEAEGDQLLTAPDDPDVYLPVRRFLHDQLLASPELLERYRLEEEPRAARLLQEGRFDEAERTRLLTPSGFEATLRLAQLELESARFESARLFLEQLDRHPDRTGRAGADAAKLAGAVASYLGRDAVRGWAERWAKEAGLDPSAVVRPAVRPPAAAMQTARTLFDGAPMPDWSMAAESPLQSLTIDPERSNDDPQDPARQRRNFGLPWIFPTESGGRVYVNNGETISAWDSATLTPVWSVTPTSADGFPSPQDEFISPMQMSRGMKEDIASVTVHGGLVIAATGIPEGSTRRGDRRLHALDAATGRPVWSTDVQYLDARLADSYVRGPAVVDGDTVIVAARRPGQLRRITTLHMVGLDLYTGALRWVRLVGNVGTQPWGNRHTRSDGSLVWRGIVYRADEMGIIGAFEAATGRPVWVRLSQTARAFDPQFRPTDSLPASDITTPVIDGESLYFVEPPRGRILRLDASTGRLTAKREPSELGEPRYLVRAGGWLAAVGPNRIALVPLAGFDTGVVRLTPPFGSPGITGRVVAADTGLIVPLADALAVIDPANPDGGERVAISGGGHVLVGTAAEGHAPHVLLADSARLHSFMRWEQAEALLQARIRKAPTDTLPLLTFIELAHRTGRAGLIPQMADRALTLLEADALSPQAPARRERLFRDLLEVMQNSRRGWARAATGSPAPVKDLSLLDEIDARLDRAAETPGQRVARLFEEAWLRETQVNPVGAVESYQRVLLDDDLSSVTIDPGTLLDDPAQATSSILSRAGAEATTRLMTLLKRVGPAPYAAFDDEAQRAFESLPAPRDAAQLSALAARYPAALVTPNIWHDAAALHAAAGSRESARRAAGAGLRAAQLGAMIGREQQEGVIGRLASAFIAYSTGAADAEPAYRMLRRLASEHPAIQVRWHGGQVSPSEAAARLRAELSGRTGLARIGTDILPGVQIIEGWEPVEPLIRGVAGASGDCIAMHNDGQRMVALWGTSPDSGSLQHLWTRPFQVRPVVVRVTPDHTLLFWPTTGGGSVEAVSSIDGSTLWRTQEFGALFDGAPVTDTGDRLLTPMDGPVRPDDLLVCASERTLTLVQRRGRAAAFDLETGQSLWHSTLMLSRVYDIEQVGDHVLIAGAGNGQPDNAGRTPGSMVSLRERTGQVAAVVGAEALGDHVRWIRATRDGDAVIATSNGLVRLTPSSGNVRWSVDGAPGKGSSSGWIVGDAAFVVDAEMILWRVSLADGSRGAEPLETRSKLSPPMSSWTGGQHLTLSSAQGLLIYGADGRLVGTDALDAQGSIEPPVAGESLVVAVEAPRQEDSGSNDEGTPARVYLFSHPSGKLVKVERVRLRDGPRLLHLIDGKVLITEGPVTFVLDAPAP